MTKSVFKETADAAFRFLTQLHASSDLYPPLKGVISETLCVVNIVKGFRTSKTEWEHCGNYMKAHVASVVVMISDSHAVQVDEEAIRKGLHELCSKIAVIRGIIEAYQSKSSIQRAIRATTYPTRIAAIQCSFDDAITSFNFNTEAISGHAAVYNVAGDYIVKMEQNFDLAILPYAEGASWSSDKTCLSGTRSELLSEIWHWIHHFEVEAGAQIFLLADVAGSGKTTISHSIAQQCKEEGILGSCFFFDGEVADRKTPKKLLSSILLDLVERSGELADNVAQALAEDRSLATASLTRQFEELIAPFLGIADFLHADGQPTVIVIDALDQACTPELLRLLTSHVPKLSGLFRFFITSRAGDEIVTVLSRQKHVRSRGIDIDAEVNLRDLAVYTRSQLDIVIERKGLPVNWPGEEDTKALIDRADGLIVWISIICEYLCTSVDPAAVLRCVLSHSTLGLHTRPAFKMDQLYATILSKLPWDDPDFRRGYQSVMGTVLSLSNPLSFSAFEAFLQTRITAPVIQRIVGYLSSLLTGLSHSSRRVRIIHLTFREYITTRAKSSPESVNYHVDEDDHHDIVATICLDLINNSLRDVVSATAGSDSGFSLPQTTLSEQLWYGCRFWHSHIIKVKSPSTPLVAALRVFLENNFVLWFATMAGQDNFQDLGPLTSWIQKSPFSAELWVLYTQPTTAAAILKLAEYLIEFDRKDEALFAFEAAAVMHQHLHLKHPGDFGANLAQSLHHLSDLLQERKRLEEALRWIKKAVELRRELATQQPVIFDGLLAASLLKMSQCLRALGRRNESLWAVEQSVNVYRHLAGDNPATFNASLAAALDSLSDDLAALGRTLEGLAAIHSSVQLRRQIIADRLSKASSAGLAVSLSTLAQRLSEIPDRHEESYQVMQEAISIQHQLDSEDRALNKHMTVALYNLSTRLGQLQRKDEALQKIQSAIHNCRPAAARRRMTSHARTVAGFVTDATHREATLTSIRQVARRQPTA
ncbi:hypothetical protein HWV62_41038 [Athelia sp. TMB]|nr:hypothetical protein HWV62_41038 [Athelia sp. TMB]